MVETRSKSEQSQTGLILFALYTAFYAGFVFINAFAPESMERVLFAGLNVAVVYGFALIIGAIVMSAIYGWLSRSRGESENAAKAEGTGQ